MVNQSKYNTDRAFRKSLKPFRQSPPEGVWNGIVDTLDRDRRKARMIWMARIAASAALIVAVGGTWLFLQRPPDREIVQSEVPQAPAGEQAVEGAEPGAVQEAASEEKPEVPFAGEEMALENSKAAEETPEIAWEPTGTDRESGEPSGKPGPGGTVLAGLDREIPETAPADERVSLQTLNGKRPDRLIGETADAGYLLAVRSPYPSVTVKDKGIDVFEELEKDAGYDKWSVGGQVSPLYSYRSLGAATGTAAPTGVYNDVESGMLAYSGGVKLNYFPARRLSLQSGVYYSRMGISISNAYLASVSEYARGPEFTQPQLAVANSSGQIEMRGDKSNTVFSSLVPAKDAGTDFATNVTDNWETQDAREGELLQRFEYLEIPMILRYRLVDRKVGLNLMGGFSTNFLVGNKVFFEEGGSREFVGTTGSIKTVNYSSIVGLGLQYSLSRNFCLNLEPTFRYYINSINVGPGIGSHPYSIGFFTGISYSF